MHKEALKGNFPNLFGKSIHLGGSVSFLLQIKVSTSILYVVQVVKPPEANLSVVTLYECMNEYELHCMNTIEFECIFNTLNSTASLFVIHHHYINSNFADFINTIIH